VSGLVEIVGLFLLVVGAGLVVGACYLVSVPLAVLAAGVFVLFAGVVTVYLANSTASLRCGGRDPAGAGVRTPRGDDREPRGAADLSTLVDWLSGPKSSSGISVSETSSLGMPAVWRAVNLIASTCASLPLHAYRQGGGLAGRQTRARRRDLLRNPHPDMPPFELWETVYAHMLLWGNAYLWVGRDRSAASWSCGRSTRAG
jgi:hypothetical protein